MRRRNIVRLNWIQMYLTDENGRYCSVCGCLERYKMYYLMGADEKDTAWIDIMWRCTSLADFGICKKCAEESYGYPRLDADEWLQKKILEYEDNRKVLAADKEDSGSLCVSEFKCQRCGILFEKSVSVTSIEHVLCPACRSHRIEMVQSGLCSSPKNNISLIYGIKRRFS